ncbi:3-deoxy-manno-octulosonate cytidylyltransferase [Moraxella sp. Tifton1]|uniref:3-deoxy-manno-octulosonate cytidylyltransferase n=1 Tax=Moraxella oculi TaxID=2940516 RepID=UPI0020117A6D|nr:3-deoxy-manno-octulosonate cytidylyltransferase [Moraxella sp. Tifton1]MCL1623671.1 3-deoxy-manno-octulosonate cytidylyltransferase [Moraxella sp. Tifton1]
MTTNPKTHIIIPARYHSTRLPAKPLLNLHGKPMILWTAEKALQATFADSVCVATDDERIVSVCEKSGIPVVMTGKHASGTDRLGEVVRLLNLSDDDIIINMQGDEPLVPPMLLEQAKNLLLNHDDCVMATLCEVIDNHDDFYKNSVVKVVHARQNALYFSRSSIPYDRDAHLSGELGNTPQNAYRHLGVYAYRVKLLKEFGEWEQGVLERLESLEQLRILENGQKIAIDIAKVALPLGVDTQEDLDRLNAMPIDEFLQF